MNQPKIAIITLHSVKNYGSVLQAYATQTIFTDLGLNAEIIDFRRPWETPTGYWFYLPEGGMKDCIRQMVYFPSKVRQKIIFEQFVNSHLHLSPCRYTTEKDFEKYPIEADIYCSGSDQVWNSGWNNGVIAPYYLSFADRSRRLIAYASSFGGEEVDEKDQSLVKRLLQRYQAISVRETNSVKTLTDLGIDGGEVVLDPTLQLTNDQWNRIIEDQAIDTGYVLLIQLNRNHRFDSFAVDFARTKGKKLIRLCLRYDQAFLPGKHVIIPKVEDYIRYIKYADYVLTDSFHAVSFSLNYSRQFYCILPEKYSSRLKSILELSGLGWRTVSNYQLQQAQDTDIDYGKVQQVINREREKSADYLRRALRLSGE